MPRVLHLIDSAGLYGAERVILNLSEELRRTRFDSIIGTLEDGPSSGQELKAVARERGIPTLSIPLKDRLNPANICIVGKHLRNHQIDIVHSHGYKPTLLGYLPSRCLKIPLIATCHLWAKEDWKLRIYFVFESVVLKALPVVIGVSEEICDQIALKGVKKERIKLILNGIDLANYPRFNEQSKQTLKDSLNIQEGEFVIGSVGRLTNQKAHHFLIDAVKRLKAQNVSIKCLIAGDGNRRQELEEKIRIMGLSSHIQLLGFRKDVIEILDLMDVFVLTSIDEGLPMALLEAMARAKPVVSTPVGGIDRVIRHGENCLLYAAGDVERLVGSILQIKNNHGMGVGLGRAAYETVMLDFSSKAMAEKYMAIYEEIMKTG